MKPHSAVALLVAFAVALTRATTIRHESTEPEPRAHHIPDIYDAHVRTLDGKMVEFRKYKGSVLLIANLASQCGYTDMGYKQLNSLHKEYNDQGLRILGFPCNQFGGQEPGGKKEIMDFANEKGAEFEIFEKINVNGPNTHELYRLLKGEHKMGADPCQDENANCPEWADMGECTKNPEYMLVRCQRSCDQCRPLFQFGGDIRWNFEYFLVGKDGHVAQRFKTGTDLLSEEVRKKIETELNREPAHDEL